MRTEPPTPEFIRGFYALYRGRFRTAIECVDTLLRLWHGPS